MNWLFMGVLFMAAAPPLPEPPTQLTTITGYVIDSACLFIKQLDKPVSPQCAIDCARAGSPLVILADDGTIYLPISGEMPASGQNDRLLPFAGERVTLRGKLFERGGSHAVVIEEIRKAEAPR